MTTPSGGAGPQEGPWRAWLCLAGLVGLVRLHRLGDWSLWYDEAVTVADAWHGENLTNPLGYLVVRAFAQLCGGTDPFALRLPAALFGWLTIPLTWWAFRPLAGDRRAALAALFVALSSWSLYWSQNARFYTMTQAVGLVGTGLFLRGLGRERLPLALAGIGVSGLGALLHPSALLLTAALVGAACLARLEGGAGQLAKRLMILGLLGALAISPWAYGAFLRFMAAKDTEGLGSVVRLVQSSAFFLTPTLSLAALVGAACAFREGGLPRWLTLVPVLGGLAAAAAAWFAASSAQYVFVFLPALALLAAWPVAQLAATGRVAWTLVLCAPLVANSALYFSVRHGERPRWKEAYTYAWDQREPADLVLGMQAPVGEYYLAPGSTDLREPTRVSWLERTNAHAWKPWAARDRGLWIVLRPAFLELWPDEERVALERFLREECRMMRRFDVHMEARDLDVEVWHRPRRAKH